MGWEIPEKPHADLPHRPHPLPARLSNREGTCHVLWMVERFGSLRSLVEGRSNEHRDASGESGDGAVGPRVHVDARLHPGPGAEFRDGPGPTDPPLLYLPV